MMQCDEVDVEDALWDLILKYEVPPDVLHRVAAKVVRAAINKENEARLRSNEGGI